MLGKIERAMDFKNKVRSAMLLRRRGPNIARLRSHYGFLPLTSKLSYGTFFVVVLVKRPDHLLHHVQRALLAMIQRDAQKDICFFYQCQRTSSHFLLWHLAHYVCTSLIDVLNEPRILLERSMHFSAQSSLIFSIWAF